ncbi:MAG TPA: hypothetical protein PK609_00840 [Candidatus Paceibacterota bacterium]|jgi:hypothetical protein|nr:hypothetical protein [Candidatus Paceibacterota bacterium]
MENIDWVWVGVGALCIAGSAASIQLMMAANSVFAQMWHFVYVALLGAVGCITFFTGLGLAHGDSRPSEHVGWLLIGGSAYAAYCLVMVTLRHFRK